jgi:hypothetical protein
MALAITAPACFGAPSRPSATPMPTMMTERIALPSVRHAGRRPAWNQIAAVISIPLPLDSRVRSNCPAAVINPAPTRAARWRQGGAWAAACSTSSPSPPHTNCCAASSNPVSAAAAKPVPAPVRMTASQNPAAPRLAKMGGSFCPPGKGFSDFAFSVSPTALPSLADPDRHRPAAGGTIIPFQQA